jgi:hypothetical protein
MGASPSADFGGSLLSKTGFCIGLGLSLKYVRTRASRKAAKDAKKHIEEDEDERIIEQEATEVTERIVHAAMVFFSVVSVGSCLKGLFFVGL